jgi:hypothetical protein
MHIIRTWAQLALWSTDDAIGRLLQERRKQLAEYGDLERHAAGDRTGGRLPDRR